MVTIDFYFDYAKNRGLRGAEPMTGEEIADVKWRVHRFKTELALGVKDPNDLNFISTSIGDRVAAYRISSPLDFVDLKKMVTETARDLRLEPPDFRTINGVAV